MKILILNYEYPPLGGGAGVCTKYEAEGLAKRGHDVTVITTWFDGEQEEETIDHLKIIRLKSARKYTYKSDSWEKISWMMSAQKFLNSYLTNYHFDICLANFALPGGEVALRAKRKFDLPYMVISHGHDIPWVEPKTMFKYHLLTYFWIKKITTNSLRNILLSKYMKEIADSFLGAKYFDRNIVIPNGCHTDFFQPEYSKKSSKFTIIFVGRLTDQKKPFVFLESVKKLSERLSDFSVHILGDGPLRSAAEKYVEENNLNKYVQFFGWVDKDKMLLEYQSANLQIVTSSFEAFSVATLESLSTGQYLISTPVSGNTDAISPGINGDFFAFNDSSELADKIYDYYQTKFKNNYRIDQEFLTEFRQKYDWKNIVLLYEQAIIQALSKN